MRIPWNGAIASRSRTPDPTKSVSSQPSLMNLRPRILRLLAPALLALPSLRAAAATDPKPPETMAFQGFLTDKSGNPRGGGNQPVNLQLTFRIYDSDAKDAKDTKKLWEETQTVTVDNGHFSVVLGGAGSNSQGLSEHFIGDTSTGRFLGITVGTEDEISPRIQFLSAPYAHLARFANGLVDATGKSILETGTTSVGINLTKGAQPSATLQVNGDVSATEFIGSGARLTNLPGSNLQSASLRNAQIADDAAIADSKLATIASPGKVADSALSSDIARRNAPNTFVENQRINGSLVLGNGDASISKFVVVGSEGQGRGVQIDNREIKFRGNPPGTIGGNNFSLFANRIPGALSIEDTSTVNANGTPGTPLLTVFKSGRIGIGTGGSEPNGLLEVNGGPILNGVAGWYYNATGGGKGPANADAGVAIYTRMDILAGHALIVFSDARLKESQRASDSGADLSTLMRLVVTDYQYIDKPANGSRSHKKLIAQQVEEVFPQAITRHVGVVPDIYQTASQSNGWIHLSASLKKGDRVRLITGTSEKVHEVLETTSQCFRVTNPPAEEQVFVYGHEVEDVRAVDYDAISMLNVSATQQIKRDTDHRFEAVQNELDSLRAAVRAAESRELARTHDLQEKDVELAALRSEMAELRNMVRSISTAALRPKDDPSLVAVTEPTPTAP